jgi:hypothetical protein
MGVDDAVLYVGCIYFSFDFGNNFENWRFAESLSKLNVPV